MTDHLIEKTISTKSIFKGKIIDLEVQDVVLPDGQESKREIIHHPGAVAVVAFTDEGKLILVKQYRKALEKVIAEIPAGKLEVGEDPLECARRELEEETGVKAEELSKLHSFYTSPGFANEIVYVYLAEGLKVGTLNMDEDEFVERIDVTLEEAKQMIATEEIHDAKTIYAIQYWELIEAKAHE
ncbi:NUDIX hydrolase [Salipaludibacillus sp. HK11]|uniref:NUDIX hydrolase n=1 Tax=Salipaludibacillus sp. HK11 TaxID=3394320 RepID=UPI0039FBCD30